MSRTIPFSIQSEDRNQSSTAIFTVDASCRDEFPAVGKSHIENIRPSFGRKRVRCSRGLAADDSQNFIHSVT